MKAGELSGETVPGSKHFLGAKLSISFSNTPTWNWLQFHSVQAGRIATNTNGLFSKLKDHNIKLVKSTTIRRKGGFRGGNMESGKDFPPIFSTVNVVIIFQKIMVSGPNHDRNNNMLSCYQIKKLQRKGRGIIATKTIPGTIIL